MPERRLPTFLELESLAASHIGQDGEAFRTIIENLPVMCYVTEPEPPFTAIYISPDLESFGYSLEEWKTGDEIWEKIVHPDDKAIVWAEAETARNAGRAFDLEYRIVNSDGTIRWVRDRSRYVTDADGKKLCCLGIMVDVTERRETGLKLVESEERYKKVFEDANDIIYIHDLNGNYLWINNAAEKILGYTPEEALQMHMSEIAAPEQYELTKEMLRKKLAGDTDKTEYEIECIAKDGHRVTLEVNTSIIRENGVPFAVQGIARDVTERKQGQEALLASEERYRKIFDDANDIVYQFDREGNFVWISKSVERIFGYPHEEASRMNIKDFVAPESRELSAKMIAAKLAGDTSRTVFEVVGVGKDGRHVPIEINSNAVMRDGVCIGVQGIARDITERKLAQQKILEIETRFQKAFENTNDIVYNYDASGNFTWISQSVERILGYTPEESLSMNVMEMVAPDYQERGVEMMRAKLDGLTARTDFEIDFITKDGRRVSLDVNSNVIYRDGEPAGVQGIARDITDRKLAQQRLLESEERYRNVFEDANDIVYNYDLDGKFIWVSRSIERILGYTPEEIVTMRIEELVAPDEIPRMQRMSAVKLSGEVKRTEYEIDCLKKDGTRVTLEVNSSVIAQDGKAIGIQGIARDVTEKRSAQQRLVESEERYRRVFEDSSDIVYNLDLDGNIMWISRSVERLLGYTVEEALKMKTRDMAALGKSDVIDEMVRAKSSGQSARTEYEVECVSKNGTPVTLEIASSVLMSEGKAIGIQGIARDVTHRRLSEQALRESESKFRTLAETASDAILTIDEKSVIIFGNAAAETIFGYSAEELVGMSLTDLIPERFRERHLAGIDRYSSTGKKGFSWKAVAFPGLHKNGKEVPLEFSFAQFEKEGSKFFTGIIRDVTERNIAEAALRSSEEQFRELFENANDLLYTHDLRGRMVSINRATERILGFSREEAKLLNVNETIAPESRELAKEMIRRKVAGENIGEYELEIIAKDGRRVPVEVNTRLIVKDGVPVGITGIARDITERKLADNSMRESLSLLTSTLESSNDGVIVVNPEIEIVVHNQRFVDMFNIPPHVIEQLSGAAATEFIKDQLVDPSRFVENTVKLYENPLGTNLDTLTFKDGRIFERYSQPQFLEGVAVGRVCSFRDVTERVRSEERLRHHALHDTLTNLPNRAQFMNHLRNAIERVENNSEARFAVLFLDLDRFKVVNDSLGHVVGDDLLVAIAERLVTCLRPGDVVARLGGDEFCILLNRTGTSEDVAHVAERIQAKVSEPFAIDNYEVFTTASVGIIMSDDVRREPEDFLRDADAAMYRAKESGKARYAIFDREMHVRNLNLLKIETDLRRAIERNEFQNLYQPIVRMETGAIREFESLIRWNHPEFGVVSPAEFIGVAEETGLIIPIGRGVIEESCRQIAEWQKLVSYPLAISVNLSAKQLMHPSLIPQVEEILLNTSLTSRQLKLEVTETTVMENSDRALAVLEELEDLGVALSTDDFGTGYSSLSYLHRFPFTRLKIDQSFTKRMDKDAKSLAIVKTILMLGRNLGIEVVAEGIETESQYELLLSLGCHLGQGYFFSAPVDAAAAGTLLTSRQLSIVAGDPAVQDFSEDPGFEVH